MDALKERMVNYVLDFIKEKRREVRKSDLFDEIMRQFASELKNKCSNDNPFADEMFTDSVIRETHVVYGLTYTAENDKLIGLTEEGNEAADHAEGISGYLCDKEKERKELKLQNKIQTYSGIGALIIAFVSFSIDYQSPNSIWSNNIVYLTCGVAIGLGATRLFRIIADIIEKKRNK
ncbi:MAG: hypothetical protein K6D55_01940 [Prevotella sp.]|nr:hypothetical protein [Prevotella sp.]